MYLTVDLLANPSAHTAHEAIKLALIYLAINLIGSIWLWQGTRKIAGFAPSYILAYVLAMPAILLYLSPMLTLLKDVMAHQFHFAERFILVLAVVVATQMLGVFYAVAIRYPINGQALGLQDGMAVSLWMWLSTLPVGLILLWVNGQFNII
jgi:hypothetical protein